MQLPLNPATAQQTALIIQQRRRERGLILTAIGWQKLGSQHYGELLRRVGEVTHSSCLLLTSREKPKEIAYLKGAAMPVRSLQLPGLDVESVQEMFTTKGCFHTTDELEWRRLRECYAGNPLMLLVKRRFCGYRR